MNLILDECYNQNEISILNRLAEAYIMKCFKGNQPTFYFCQELYRTEPPSYFKDIENNHYNVMKPYLKDSNGDKLSPINGRIKGLFFSANVNYRTGKPPTSSPYGSKRFLVLADIIVRQDTRLYFADFYCRSRLIHHVTLVATKYGSDAHRFCSRYLHELDKRHNMFLRFGGNTEVQVTGSGVWIELLYTENIDIDSMIDSHMGRFCDVFSKGRTGPLSKSQICSHCNIKL